MAGKYTRKPRSTCIAYTSWTATAKTVQSGKRKPAPGSKGVVEVVFRRNFPKYGYTLSTPLAYAFWKKFINSGSKGKFWNYQMKGKF